METSVILLGCEDEHQFSAVYRQYYPALCVFAERIVGIENAKDVVEELFTTLWNKSNKLENETHLQAFLYHSAKNACLNFLKSDLRTNERNTVFAKEIQENEDLYLAEITRSELLRKLHLAIAELPEKCGRIIHLGYVEGLKNPQIAEQLGLSIQTVKNQKLRGIALLKKRFPNGQLMLILSLLP